MWYLAFLAFILAAIIIGISLYFSNKVIYPNTRSHENTLAVELEKERIDKAWFDSLPKEEIYIASPYGYQLYGLFFPNTDAKKAIIICHGITYTLYGSVKYMKMFYDRGYNILIYDHRNHGRSGGTKTTYGYYEKCDLMVCTDWVINRCGLDCRIGLHGESMGAAIALQNTALDSRIAFCIADCGYSDLMALLKYRMKCQYKLPAFPFLPVTSLLNKLRTGMFFSQVSPIRELKHIDAPVLFVHGKEDLYILPEMSQDMYHAKKGVKKLYLAPNARHAESHWKNQQEYEQIVHEFLTEIGL